MDELPNIRLYTPVWAEQKFVKDLTYQISGWRRSIRSQAGYWLGDTFLDEEYTSLQDLVKFFYEYLGYHWQEVVGGQRTWQGMIYEMDLTVHGVTRRRSFDELVNYVKSTYIDPTTNTTLETSVASVAASITKYTRKEDLLLLDGFPLASAEARRDTFLREHAWPVARTVGVGFGEDVGSRLDISVAGYAMTASHRFESAGDGSMDNLSTWIREILQTDCPLLKIGSIQSNSIQVKKETQTPQRASDVILELTSQGDADGNPYRFYVDDDRRANYVKIDRTPLYYLRSGGLVTSAGGKTAVNPWLVRPAVVRDLTYPTRKNEVSGWLDDARDFYVEEVEVGTGAGLVLKTDLFEETEILAAQQEYTAQLEQQQQQSSGLTGAAGTTGSSRHIREHLGISREAWLAMTEEERLAAKKKWWTKRRARRSS